MNEIETSSAGSVDSLNGGNENVITSSENSSDMNKGNSVVMLQKMKDLK